jgi:hypothetical protein
LDYIKDDRFKEIYEEDKMDTSKKTARTVGALFLTAMVAGMLRYVLLDPILDAPDYLVNVSANENQVIIGVLSFFYSGCCSCWDCNCDISNPKKAE